MRASVGSVREFVCDCPLDVTVRAENPPPRSMNHFFESLAYGGGVRCIFRETNPYPTTALDVTHANISTPRGVWRNVASVVFWRSPILDMLSVYPITPNYSYDQETQKKGNDQQQPSLFRRPAGLFHEYTAIPIIPARRSTPC